MFVTAGVSSDAAIAVREKLRGGIGQTRVRRYWPGKAPEWAEEAEDDDNVRMQTVSVLDRAFPKNDDLGVSRKDDPRLRRLAQTRVEDRDEVRADHRRIRKAKVVSTEEEEERNQEDRDDDDDDEDALEERRRRIREKNLKRAQEEAALLPLEEEDELQEEEEEEEESEYETDSEDGMPGIAMIKPVFVPKSERDTIAERERLEAEEEALEELAKRKLEMRKVETKQIVVEEVRKDEEIRKNMLLEEANIGDVETDDELNEAEEYEVWKTREIGRIKRERDAREAMLREREEIEKLRNMTEKERREWERKNPKPSSAQPKKKWNFMQKYYHKGAFFQADHDDEAGSAGTDGIFQRDFSAPTGEDRLDKSILPKVMQVKHFGRSGRTKWTHLVNEDTTDWSNPWTSNDPLREKNNKKMAGMDAPIAKPKGSKKMKDWET
ncbi:PREDICTED: microfibrillar-associated protein 1-like isoform X2 [Camelina sativa]|uniref:Microfibrillar-associated protein 1-like isoform X1 n=1 Tax=Camelina sativa TaxID=90675 RepID=A0ABM0T3X3_CAMSA|nr:PREDICTED: microfibrillar-associated protein 1-like isoform X1 [Camelina sativa]XP_010420520.1 PREDICTED: microfibrillar-associated protein 1-like isoform X1 [Camelina sativa]XP_010420521.1 PREDICTED: microfibrillar-associated protein 1-like isoform X2 [Camelina sativa]